MSAHSILHNVRILLGEYLLRLGDDEAADELFGAAFRERNAGVNHDITPTERWDTVRDALLTRVA
jgi:hypothetical protein